MSKDARLAGRALILLEAVAKQNGASIAQLAEQAGLPYSTTHRIMMTLVDRNYVVCPCRGRYFLGPAVRRLGEAVSIHQILADIGRPVLAKLARGYDVHSHLGVLDHEMVTYLVRCASGSHPIASVEGRQLEAYCSAIGKVLLAHQAPAEMRAYLRQGNFIPLTANTVTRATDLAEELTRVRELGYALDREEIVLGLRCTAVPIFDESGAVCAAISASGQADRMSDPFMDTLRGELERAALWIQNRVFS